MPLILNTELYPLCSQLEQLPVAASHIHGANVPSSHDALPFPDPHAAYVPVRVIGFKYTNAEKVAFESE